ncbi:MAG: hypothetical protein JWQ71_2154 [Pedosphaera sp.]|nr:hypothetical protein [Pedosphaera sp.]
MELKVSFGRYFRSDLINTHAAEEKDSKGSSLERPIFGLAAPSTVIYEMASINMAPLTGLGKPRLVKGEQDQGGNSKNYSNG